MINRLGGRAGGDGLMPTGFTRLTSLPGLLLDDEEDGSGDAMDCVSTEMPDDVEPVEHDRPGSLVTTIGLLDLSTDTLGLTVGGGCTWSGSRMFESSGEQLLDPL